MAMESIAFSDCTMLYIFFSSRRRHTRFDCDWSSDVCSSDLLVALAALELLGRSAVLSHPRGHRLCRRVLLPSAGAVGHQCHNRSPLQCEWDEIGRASCRERG